MSTILAILIAVVAAPIIWLAIVVVLTVYVMDRLEKPR